MEKVVERFIRYAKQYTSSDPESRSYPSTDRQLVFMKKLVEELKAIGLQEVEMDKYGYVTATVPANGVENCPVVGFIAHVDTSPDFSGENVNPQIISNYDGARAVQVGTANFVNPKATMEIIDGLTAYLQANGLTSIKDLIGSVRTH